LAPRGRQRPHAYFFLGGFFSEPFVRMPLFAYLFISSELSRCAHRALLCSPRGSCRAGERGVADWHDREATGPHTHVWAGVAPWFYSPRSPWFYMHGV
jgi:hypothetical protein